MLTLGTAVLLLPSKTSLHQQSLCRFQLKSSDLGSANISKQNNGRLFQRNQTFSSPINQGFGILQSYRNKKMKNMSFVCCSMESGGDPSSFPLNLLPAGTEQWQLWLLGSAVPLILSFTSGKWGPLLKLKNDADKLLDRAEQISDVVEEMAEKVEKMADEIGNELPEGGKLRAAFDRVENLADQTAKTAERAGELIDKVQEMEDKMEEFMDSMDDKDKNKPSVVAKDNNKVNKPKDVQV